MSDLPAGQHSNSAVDHVVVRVALGALSDYVAWGDRLSASFASGRLLPSTVIESPDLSPIVQIEAPTGCREALYLATPDFHDSVDSQGARDVIGADPTALATLTKYVARLCTRSTPFGLFGAVGTGSSSHSDIWKVPSQFRRAVSVDAGWLSAVTSAAMDRGAIDNPAIGVNTTLVRHGSTYRFLAPERFSNSRGQEWRLAMREVEAQPWLEELVRVAAGPTSIKDLVTTLRDCVPTDLLEHSAVSIVADVVKAGLLVVRGPDAIGDPRPEMTFMLKASEGSTTSDSLARISTCILKAEALPVTADATAIYREIEQVLQLAVDRNDKGSLPARPAVQVDLLAEDQAAVPVEWIGRVRSAVHELERFRPQLDPMQRYRSDFQARFGEGPVRLVDLFDDDAGIGSRTRDDPAWQAASPLIHGLAAVPARGSTDAVFDARDIAMLHIARTFRDRREIDIVDLDPAEFGLDGVSDSRHGDVLTALVKTFVSADGHEVGVPSLLGCYGAGGVQILSRFGWRDDAIQQHAASLVGSTLEHDPSRRHALDAELMYAPLTPRHANVARRRLIHSWVVRVLDDRLVPDSSGDLALNDLLVTVDTAGEFRLWSKSKDTEVRLHHSSAFNVALPRTPPLARFLHQLSRQHSLAVDWDWGALVPLALDAAPRVVAHGVVVAPARWVVMPVELRALRAGDHEVDPIAVANWRRARGVPRLVSHVNYLNGPAGSEATILDLDNPLVVQAFLAGSADPLTLHEVPDVSASQLSAGVRAVEVAVSHHIPGTERESKVDGDSLRGRGGPSTWAPDGQGHFDRRWLYANLYVGPDSQDLIIDSFRRTIGEVPWFFVRYSDSEGVHLRLRALAGDGVAAAQVRKALDNLTKVHPIRDIAWRSYMPERLRYGGDGGLEIAHQVFHGDSCFCAEVIASTLDDQLSLDRLLSSLAVVLLALPSVELTPPHDEIEFVDSLRRQAGKWINFDRVMDAQMSIRYRQQRAAIEQSLDGLAKHHDRDRFLAIGDGVRRYSQLEPASTSATVERFFASLVHMHVIRMFRRDHRVWEFVVYDSLWRYLRGRRGRRHAGVLRA